MLMNQQSVSVQTTAEMVKYLKKCTGEDSIHLHARNVYLFQLPAQGEITELNEAQKKFIFKEELSLYEEQFDISCPYDDQLFETFFKIEWHGVNYHIDISSLSS